MYIFCDVTCFRRTVLIYITSTWSINQLTLLSAFSSLFSSLFWINFIIFQIQLINFINTHQLYHYYSTLFPSFLSLKSSNTFHFAGLKITVGHRTMSDQIRILSDQTKNIPDILSDGKTWSKIKCPTRVCFCPTINWRYPTKLLILSDKYLSNKSS